MSQVSITNKRNRIRSAQQSVIVRNPFSYRKVGSAQFYTLIPSLIYSNIHLHCIACFRCLWHLSDIRLSATFMKRQCKTTWESLKQNTWLCLREKSTSITKPSPQILHPCLEWVIPTSNPFKKHIPKQRDRNMTIVSSWCVKKQKIGPDGPSMGFYIQLWGAPHRKMMPTLRKDEKWITSWYWCVYDNAMFMTRSYCDERRKTPLRSKLTANDPCMQSLARAYCVMITECHSSGVIAYAGANS